jgi:hypothetical protein
MNLDRHYLEKAVTEVNRIGGPPISAQDMMPPTRKERWKAHYKIHAVRYKLTFGWTAVAFGVLVLAVFAWKVSRKVAAESRASDEREVTVIAAAISHSRKVHQEMAKAFNARKVEQLAQRDSDIALIRRVEHEQAPMYEKVMDDMFHADNVYNSINMNLLWIRFPRMSADFDKIRPRLARHYWGPATQLGVSGYTFEYDYEFVKTKEVPAEKVSCFITAHVGMKTIDRCFVDHQ